MRSDRVDATRIDVRLVRTLLAQQFPAWHDRPVRLVERGGNDHRIFRLGDDLSVRLPSPPGYVAQVVKEQTWFPRLTPLLLCRVCCTDL
jgi:aminoglycoside phosphotransferase (APT) family kinase protein